MTAVSNASGAASSIDSYDEYGVPGTSNSGRFQYTGQIWIPELGLYHYKARAYSPALGRFMQTDPVGYQDQMNLYAYVGDDPTNQTDASGLGCGTHIEGKDSPDCASFGAGPSIEDPRRQGAMANIRTGASIGAGVIPGVGAAQSVVELATGQDYIAGEETSRVWAAVGLAAGLIPGGKAGVKAGVKLIGKDAEKGIGYLVRAAQKEFPKKAGKIEQHHITPKYLGGAVDGPTARLDAAYHQQITNAFRQLWKYGQKFPSAADLKRIMKEVYDKFPLR